MKRIFCGALFFPLMLLALVSCFHKKVDSLLINRIGGVRLIVSAPGAKSNDVVNSIRERLESLSFENCFVYPLENDEYIIEAPAITNVNYVIGALKPGSGLGFWETYPVYQLEGISKLYEYDDWITDPGYYNTACVGYSTPDDTAFVNMRIASEGIYSLLPDDCRLMWALNPSDNGYLDLYAIKCVDGRPLLDGTAISEFAVEEGEGIGHYVAITMNEDAAEKWQMITKANIGRDIAISFNGKIVSCPKVVEEIPGGRCNISGNFTRNDANAIAILLMMQSLRPMKLEIVSAEYVAPTPQKIIIKK